MKSCFIKGYCHTNRHQGIREIEEIVNVHGDIVDFKLFSDISMSMMIEIEGQKIEQLYESLKSSFKLDALKNPNVGSQKECLVFLNITFGQGKGNLKATIPQVPG